MTKDLFKKYIWIISTIYNNGRISLKDLNDKWINSYLSDGKEIPRKTFHNQRIKIEEVFDVNIECDRSSNEYYIENSDDIEKDKIRSWLLNTFALKNLVHESDKIKDRIIPEANPSGQKFLAIIVEAMRDNKILHATYKGFLKGKESSFEFEAYFVKVFKQRWYVIGRSLYYDKIMVYALDRFSKLSLTEKSYDLPTDFKSESFFQNSFGVIFDISNNPETVKIKVYGHQVKYIRALPLHHSQQEIETHEKCSIFKYFIHPSFDFKQELISHLSSVEVISPQYFRAEIKKELKSMLGRYK
jgi:hypothetical protein